MIVGLESNSKIFTVNVQGLLELQVGLYLSNHAHHLDSPVGLS